MSCNFMRAELHDMPTAPKMQQHMGQAMESWLEVVHAEMPCDTADCRQITLHLYIQDMCTQAALNMSGL